MALEHGSPHMRVRCMISDTLRCHSRPPIGIDTASKARSSKQISVTFPPFPSVLARSADLIAGFRPHSPAYDEWSAGPCYLPGLTLWLPWGTRRVLALRNDAGHGSRLAELGDLQMSSHYAAVHGSRSWHLFPSKLRETAEALPKADKGQW